MLKIIIRNQRKKNYVKKDRFEETISVDHFY